MGKGSHKKLFFSCSDHIEGGRGFKAGTLGKKNCIWSFSLFPIDNNTYFTLTINYPESYLVFNSLWGSISAKLLQTTIDMKYITPRTIYCCFMDNWSYFEWIQTSSFLSSSTCHHSIPDPLLSLNWSHNLAGCMKYSQILSLWKYCNWVIHLGGAEIAKTRVGQLLCTKPIHFLVQCVL